MTEIEIVRVAAEHPYEVVIGHDLHDRIPALVGEAARRVAVLHPPTLIAAAERVVGALASAGFEPLRIDVPDSESAKTAQVTARCWSVLGTAGFTRSDAVVGLGGGATTDLAGFVAATWLRGVRLVTVPTSLLGMVDAAVGGKTGINTPEGKNLVGAFHEPAGVLCDLDLLMSLPTAELRSGMAEVIKCGFIADPEILTLVEADPGAAQDRRGPVLPELVRRAVAVKATVVAADLRERTSVGQQVGREALNYGHTLGHAIERHEHYHWRHGEAISVGMAFVAGLARRAGLIDAELADRHVATLASVGLPTTYRADAYADLLAAMAVDKKTRGSTLRFVVLHGLARPAVLAGPEPALLAAAYADIC
ncbi:MAG: 3-dehydroquinate synthase [Microlunatus sp.]|nr:3-dehydroquinate synthase [Microlunatus sp.]MDN5771594.1 3-dehydroquinate synthase [Microlunatus sp.]